MEECKAMAVVPKTSSPSLDNFGGLLNSQGLLRFPSASFRSSQSQQLQFLRSQLELHLLTNSNHHFRHHCYCSSFQLSRLGYRLGYALFILSLHRFHRFKLILADQICIPVKIHVRQNCMIPCHLTWLGSSQVPNAAAPTHKTWIGRVTVNITTPIIMT